MNDIYAVLQQLQIPYITHDHPAVFTCEEAAPYYDNIPGGKCKNLFLRNRKGDKHFLVILEHTKRADLKKLSELLGEPKLSFASDDRLMRYLGVTPGSVTPFGLINDARHEVVVVIDKELWAHDRVSFHPNVNTATLEIARADMERFLEHYCNAVLFFSL